VALKKGTRKQSQRLVRLAARGLADQRTVAWLIEAALRYQGQGHGACHAASTAGLYQGVDKVHPGLYQPRKAKMRFLLCFIFQTRKCLKNGGASLHRTAGC
jgi:hypothetical protein